MANIRDILAQRQNTHGDYSDHARITQNIKAMMHDSPNWPRLPATHVEALEMIAHKIGRILAGDYNHPDHFLDIEGYARLVYDRLSTPEGQTSLPLRAPTLDRALRGDADFARVLEEIANEAAP